MVIETPSSAKATRFFSTAKLFRALSRSLAKEPMS